MDTIGLDLHKRESQLCILTEAAEILERRIHTSRERLQRCSGLGPRRVSSSGTSDYARFCHGGRRRSSPPSLHHAIPILTGCDPVLSSHSAFALLGSPWYGHYEAFAFRARTTARRETRLIFGRGASSSITTRTRAPSTVA
jgi:hypothetical protein